MAVNAQLKVEGLAKLRKQLKDLEDIEGRAELRDGLKAAADIVAQDARSRVPVRSGRARASVRGQAGGNKAYVVGGKKTVPYYGWLDFGSRSPVSGRPRSVGPWKKSGYGPIKGRFIYPAIDAKSDEVVRQVARAVDDAIKRLDLD